jgi:hypothetical protein
MENPNTWTLLHHDLSRVSKKAFTSTEQKAEALQIVLENHRVPSTPEEVLVVINSHADSIEKGICGSSLPAAIVNAFSKPD